MTDLLLRLLLHVCADEAVVGSQWGIIKAPVVQVILGGVKIPARTEMQTVSGHFKPSVLSDLQMPVIIMHN